MCISSWNNLYVKIEFSEGSCNIKQSTVNIPICDFLIHLIEKFRNVWTYLVQKKSAGLVLASFEIQQELSFASGLFQSISSWFLVVFPVSNFLHKTVFSLIGVT